MEQSKFYQIKNITEREYTLVGCDGSVITRPIRDIDKSASAFTIQDAKDGDVLYDGHKACIFRKTLKDDDAIWIDAHCGINMDEEFTVDNEDELWCLACVCTPATKEQRDTLMKAMADAGYTFDFEKKELRKIEQEKVMHNKLTDFEFSLKHIMEEVIECGDTHNLKTDVNMLLSLVQKPAWSEEDERFLNIAINILNSSKVYTKSPDKYEDTINWFKSLKNRVQPQPKQEWNEEDEGFLNLLLAIFTSEHPNGVFTTDNITVFKGNCVTSNRIIAWLKSLKDRVQPQSQWKPSDEQMEALEDAIRYGEEELIGILSLLYNDLKKLREE